MPFISVIVPVYNTSERLNNCIDSLIGQSLKDIEIILVDDGSTDDSGAICDRYAESDTRVRVIHKVNAGQGLARNDAIDIASGDYIAFVDSDDYLDLDCYEKVKNRLLETDADICSFGYMQHNSDGRICYKANVYDRVFATDQIKDEFILHFFGDETDDSELSGVFACMSVYKRSIIEDNHIRFQSERVILSEDAVFNLDYCKYVSKAVTMSDCFYHYWISDNSFTMVYSPERLQKAADFTVILDEYAKYYSVEQQVTGRISRALWVVIMESVRKLGSKIHTEGYTYTYKEIKALCNNAIVVDNLKAIDRDKIGSKQRMLAFFMEHKLINCVILLGIIRAKLGR